MGETKLLHRHLFCYAIALDESVGSRATEVAIVLADHADRKTNIARPSRDRIAKLLGCTGRSVARALEQLREAGWITPVGGATGPNRTRHWLLRLERAPKSSSELAREKVSQHRTDMSGDRETDMSGEHGTDLPGHETDLSERMTNMSHYPSQEPSHESRHHGRASAREAVAVSASLEVGGEEDDVMPGLEHVPDAEPDTPARRVAKRFEELRNKMWPREPSLPAPMTTLETEAEGWLQQGFPEVKLVEAINTQMAKEATKGGSPPRSLAAFRLSLRDALSKATAEKPPERRVQSASDYIRSSFMQTGQWVSQFGEMPDDLKQLVEERREEYRRTGKWWTSWGDKPKDITPEVNS